MYEVQKPGGGLPLLTTEYRDVAEDCAKLFSDLYETDLHVIGTIDGKYSGYNLVIKYGNPTS